jgi:hypothetical protein
MLQILRFDEITVQGVGPGTYLEKSRLPCNIAPNYKSIITCAVKLSSGSGLQCCASEDLLKFSYAEL